MCVPDDECVVWVCELVEKSLFQQGHEGMDVCAEEMNGRKMNSKKILYSTDEVVNSEVRSEREAFVPSSPGRNPFVKSL